MRIKTITIILALLFTLSIVLAQTTETASSACVNAPQATDLTNIQEKLEQKGLSLEQAEPLAKGIQKLIQDGINNVEERERRSFLEKLTEKIRNNDITKFVFRLFSITEEPHEQKISTRVSQLSLRPTDDLNKQVLGLRKKFLQYMQAQKGKPTAEQYTELITDALPVFEHFSQDERVNFIKKLYQLGDLYGELPESGILNLKAAYGKLMGELIKHGPGIYEINTDTLKVDLKKLNTQASGVHTVADEWKNSVYREYQTRYEQRYKPQYKQDELFFGAYQKNLGAFSYQKLEEPKGELILEDDNFAVYETELEETEKNSLKGMITETENSPDLDDKTKSALKGNLGIVSKRYIIKVKKQESESAYVSLFNNLFKQFLVTSHLDKILEDRGEKTTVSSHTLKEVFEKIVLENKKRYEEAKKALENAERSGNQQEINEAQENLQRILEESGAIMESFELGEIISSSRKITQLEKLVKKLTPLTKAKTKEELELELKKTYEKEKGRKLENLPTEVQEKEKIAFLSEIFSQLINFEVLKRLGMRYPSGHEKYSEIKGKALFVRLIDEINKGNSQFDLVNIDVHDMGKMNLASAVELVKTFYEGYTYENEKFFDKRTGEEIPKNKEEYFNKLIARIKIEYSPEEVEGFDEDLRELLKMTETKFYEYYDYLSKPTRKKLENLNKKLILTIKRLTSAYEKAGENPANLLADLKNDPSMPGRFLKLLNQMGGEMDRRLETYLNIHGHPKGFLDKKFLNEKTISLLREAHAKIDNEANFGTEIQKLILTEKPSEKLKEAYKALGKDPEKLYDDIILLFDSGKKTTLTTEQVNLLAETIGGKKFSDRYMQELSDLLAQDFIEVKEVIKKLLKISLTARDKYGPGGDEVIGGEESHEITGLLNILAYVFTTEFEAGKIKKEGIKAGAGAYHIDESLYQELKNREQAIKEATEEEQQDLPKPEKPFTVANERSEMAGTITKVIKSLSKNKGKLYWELFAYKYGEELPQELKKDLIDLIKRSLKGLKIENGKLIAEEKIDGINNNLGALLKLQKQLDLTEVWKAALGVKTNAPRENFELFYELSTLKTYLDLFIKTEGLTALKITGVEEISDEGFNDFDEESDEYLDRLAQLIKEDQDKIINLVKNYCE